jgi:hypothetical protein
MMGVDITAIAQKLGSPPVVPPALPRPRPPTQPGTGKPTNG